MAKYREIPCKYYIALGQCRRGRRAVHKTYCQHCGRYEPRVRGTGLNRKKQAIEKLKKSYFEE